MSQEMSHFLQVAQFAATLVLPPVIFASVLFLFMGVRKLRSVLWG
jgi:hypothetical protein